MSSVPDQNSHKDHIVYIDDDDDVELSRTSRYFGPQKDADFCRVDSDSGICCMSSKATTVSLSDSEDENSSRGVFDYTPVSFDNIKKFQAVSNSEPACKHKQAVKVAETDGDRADSVSAKSGPVSTFPRDSPASEGTEMKTFKYTMGRRPNDLAYDEVYQLEDETDNDDGVKHVSLNERLYHDGPPYASIEHDYGMDYISDCYNARSSFANHHTKLNYSSKSFNSRSSRSPSEVDTVVNFPLRCSSRTTPPFGDPISFSEISRTAEKLLPVTSQATVSNLPEADPISSASTATRKKRRKKKTSTSKDESASDGKDSGSGPEQSCDVNGNPLEASKSVQAYRSSGLKNRYSGRYSQNIGSSSEVQEYNGFPLSEVDDLSQAEQERQLKQLRRKARRAKQMNMFTAGTMDGNIGDASIDQLLNFIENNSNGAGKRKNKKDGSQMPSNSHVTVPVDAKSSANNKKAKDKKQKNNSMTNSKDEKESSENSSERGDDQSSSKASENGEDKTVRDFSSFDANKEPEIEVEKVDSDVANVSSHVNQKTDKQAASTNLSSEEVFRFTDLGTVPKVEAEFTVVWKKKKRSSNSNTTSQNNREVSSSTMRNHLLGGLNDHVRAVKEETSRFVHRTKPVRSVTPPPVPSCGDIVHVPPTTERSFSPSHFPELTGLQRDGRRNSTGNVPSELPAQDDSDMESVKSYPSESTKISSPAGLNPVLSYAKIAAAPKPLGSQSGCTTNTGDDVVPSLPAERRHSFGTVFESTSTCSSNTDNPEISISEKNFASRSQELPKTYEGETSVEIAKTSDVLLKPSANVIEDGSSLGLSRGDQTKSVSNDIELEKTSFVHIDKLKGPSDTVHIDKTVNELKPQKGKETHGEEGRHSKTQDESPEGSACCINQPLKKPDTVAQQSHGQTQTSRPSSATKISTSPVSRKNKTKSSVIFLDKRVRDLPKDLGIKFGFDSEEELKNFENSVNVTTSVVFPHVNGLVLPSVVDRTLEIPPAGESHQQSPVSHLIDSDIRFDQPPLPPCSIPVDHSATFNITDTIIFLKKDWDEIMALKDTDPERVMFYSG